MVTRCALCAKRFLDSALCSVGKQDAHGLWMQLFKCSLAGCPHVLLIHSVLITRTGTCLCKHLPNLYEYWKYCGGEEEVPLAYSLVLFCPSMLYMTHLSRFCPQIVLFCLEVIVYALNSTGAQRVLLLPHSSGLLKLRLLSVWSFCIFSLCHCGFLLSSLVSSYIPVGGLAMLNFP